MKEKEDLKVITKSMELVKHSFILTSNTNRYPKKFRYSLVPRMQDLSMDIYENLMEANRIDIRTERSHRNKLQTKAITSSDKLLCYIDLSFQLNLLSKRSAEYWSKLVRDVKYMSIAWRKRDNTR